MKNNIQNENAYVMKDKLNSSSVKSWCKERELAAEQYTM
jgi:hypothetical protein